MKHKLGKKAEKSGFAQLFGRTRFSLFFGGPIINIIDEIFMFNGETKHLEENNNLLKLMGKIMSFRGCLLLWLPVELFTD